MTSSQDVSEFLGTLGLVKSYFSSFFGEKKYIYFFLWCSDAPEDQTICLFRTEKVRTRDTVSSRSIDKCSSFCSGSREGGTESFEFAPNEGTLFFIDLLSH